MDKNTASPIISRIDVERLERLVERPVYQGIPGAAALQRKLENATVVEPADMPGDVITMNSVATVLDTAGDTRSELTLVYPHEIDDSPGKVSILAPVGSAILGLRVGQTAQWPMPGGRSLELRIVALLHQPEASESAGAD